MKKVLDLGSGQGDIGGALYRLGADVTIVDARQEHLKVASKKFQGLKTVKADLDREWPFANRKFDIIVDLGLLCHLRDFEAHLRQVCASTQNLILETAVCDSNDPQKNVAIEENKGIYENSANGVGCRPSAAAIERVLMECGMTFKRMDTNQLNAGPFVYDWQPKNNGDTSINNRRMWFCIRSGGAPVHFSPSMGTSHQMVGGTAPMFKIPPRQVVLAQPPIHMNAHYQSSNGPTNDEVTLAARKFAISPDNSLNRRPELRVLYIPLGNQVGMIEAFKNLGVNLTVFDFYTTWLNSGKNNHKINQQFLQIVNEFKPQFIHMQLQITDIITSGTINEARKIVPGVIISNWSGDIRDFVIDELKAVSNVVDYTLISSTGQIGMYQKAGCRNVKYWQIGFDPKVHYAKYYTNFDYDISFIANNYGAQFPDGPTRLESFSRCLQSFGKRFGIFGTGWPGVNRSCDPSMANEIYNKSVCALSISNFNKISHYFSDRLLYCLASGRPTISWYFPGCESYFVEGEEIFYARKSQDIIDLVNFCQQNPEKANSVGEKGYQKVLAEHTYTSRAQELLNIVGLSKE